MFLTVRYIYYINTDYGKEYTTYWKKNPDSVTLSLYCFTQGILWMLLNHEISKIILQRIWKCIVKPSSLAVRRWGILLCVQLVILAKYLLFSISSWEQGYMKNEAPLLQSNVFFYCKLWPSTFWICYINNHSSKGIGIDKPKAQFTSSADFFIFFYFFKASVN